MYDHTFSELANHQLRHLATHKVGCQSGDCIWSLRFSSGVCVGTYGLTYSLYHPRGREIYECQNNQREIKHKNVDMIVILKKNIYRIS